MVPNVRVLPYVAERQHIVVSSCTREVSPSGSGNAVNLPAVECETYFCQSVDWKDWVIN